MQEETYDIIYKTELNHWWYRVRRKLVAKIVASYLQGRSQKLEILDVGCGTGGLMRELRQFGDVSGVDVSPRAVAYCKERGLENVSLGDAANLPYPDGSFDIVVILDVLEHLKNDGVGIREIKRVLTHGGMAIITVPAFIFLWGVTDVVSHHYRRYTRAQIKDQIRAAGLCVRYASYFNTFLFPAIATVRLIARLLRLPMKSEISIGGWLGNKIFFWIFYLESLMVPTASFPFGVSVLILAEKTKIGAL